LLVIAFVSIGFVLLLIGFPIFLGLGLGGTASLIGWLGMPISGIGELFFASLNSFPLTAIPLFIFAGYIMVHGGSSRYLLQAVTAFTQHIPGGLAVALIMTCAFFGALTASAMATVAAIGVIMIAPMVKAGYREGMVSGLVCCSGTLGGLIPPSLWLILLGIISGISVAKLFMGGFGAGLLIAILLSIVAIINCIHGKYGSSPKVNWGARFQALFKAIPAIFTPVIILGGIYGGIFTPTEAAAVACLYGLLIGKFVYRQLNLHNLRESLTQTVRLNGMICLLIIGAKLMSRALFIAGISENISSLALEAGLSPLIFILMSTLVLLILGCIIDPMSMILVTAPMLLPTASALGIDPLLFCVYFTILIMIGQVTPPVGAILYFTSGISGISSAKIIRGTIPFLLAMVIAAILVLLFPDIVLWLPNHMVY
jgi:C4-dicarboxylate transporter DctM subunit